MTEVSVASVSPLINFIQNSRMLASATATNGSSENCPKELNRIKVYSNRNKIDLIIYSEYN